MPGRDDQHDHHENDHHGDRLTPRQFIERWADRPLAEKAAAQSHFNDLCRLLEVPAPTDHRETDSSYGFEARTDLSAAGLYATRTEDGVPLYQIETGRTRSGGFADVWKRDHFAWEYVRAGDRGIPDPDGAAGPAGQGI